MARTPRKHVPPQSRPAAMPVPAPAPDAPEGPLLPPGPGIWLVPTPIGNREDITLRALRTLAQADLIAAEDTRHTGLLLQHLGLKRPLVSLHAHNEHGRVAALLTQVAHERLRLAVVSDAGTPGLSDPGYLLVREALNLGLPLDCLPGPTAFVPALVASGLPTARFVFEGFLPPKKGRATRLAALASEPRTLVLYESPHRLLRTLTDLAQHLGPARPACVARELTKLHQDFRRGALSLLALHYATHPPKGEIVLVVAGADMPDVDDYLTEQEEGDNA